MDKILLTGGTGFLGGELLKSLVKKYEVYSIYRKDRGVNHKNNHWIKLDLSVSSDFSKVYEELRNEKIDCLIHVGGSTPNVAYSEGNYDATINGTRELVKLSRKLGIKKIIFISSMCVTFSKKGPYARSKLIAESFVKNCRIKYTILRPESIIGKSGRDFSRLVSMLRKNKFFPFIGDGKNLNQPIYYKDLIGIIEFCLESKKTDNKIYSVFGKDKLSNNEFLLKIARAMGNSRLKIIHIPKFIAYCASYVLGFFVPRLGLNPERIYIMSYSKKLDVKKLKNFPIKFTSFDEMLGSIKTSGR